MTTSRLRMVIGLAKDVESDLLNGNGGQK